MTSVRILCAVLVLAFGAALPARADQMSDLVDRYVAWRGGAAFEHLTSVHATGKLETAGLSGSIEVWSERNNRQRTDLDLGVFKTTAVVADPAWDITASGQIANLSDAEVRYARRDGALRFADALRGRGGATDRYLGTETRDGRTWGVIRVSFGDEDTYDAFIDPASGELDGLRVMEDRRGRFERFSDWRLVDGVRMAFVETTTAEVKTDDSTVRFGAISLDNSFQNALFRRPETLRASPFKGGATSTAWIPFEFFGENRIFFPARVNGRDTVVLLDSGAEASVIDKTYASQIGLVSEGTLTARGAGGTDSAGVIKDVTIEIGGVVLDKLAIVAIDIAPVGARIGHPLPFVLGGEVFNEFAVDIDFAHRRLAFRDPAHLQKPAGAVEVPLKAVQGIRAVPVSVEGGPETMFDFDLGNGSPLLVFPAYADPHGLLNDRRLSMAMSGAVGGVHPEDEATIKRLRFAGVDFHDVPTVFPGASNAGLNSNLSLGNVGLPIIDRFHVIVDFPHDRAWLTPDAERVAQPFAKDRLGLSIVPHDADLAVEYVSPGSPAEAMGFKIGDRITEIDRSPKAAWPSDSLRTLAQQPAGTVVEFTLGDGSVRRVRLEDYF
ncbi:MAG TPA: aspartyl protease family protein [Caulobacteraceae bacterium]|jgi:hypothetical protein|nr:aspartyl protease family protein [Caulobacteraceae bacterium]